MEPRFFDPYAEITRTANRLPHWQQPGATYFLTFHLADSIPQEKLGPWQDERAAWLRHHPPPWTPEVQRAYDRRFTAALERWLDAGDGACPLRQPEHAGLVGGALAHFDGDRCGQHAWAVMPNHVHALVTLHPAWTLEAMIESWKSYSARRINAALGQRGALWARDYFDRIIRDEEHYWKCARYIRENPRKAQLPAGQYLLWESEPIRTTLDADEG